MNFIEYIGESQIQIIKERFEELLRSNEGGFIIIANNETGKVTDAYMGICKDCALGTCKEVIESADEAGLLAEEELDEN